MIDELVKTVRLHLSERLTSPLMGAFLFSWCAWNYRAIMVVLSDEKIEEKFRILDQILYSSFWHSILLAAILPSITALIYLFAYPYPAKLVYEFTRKKQREILEIRRRIEGETPLTIEDSKRIRNELTRAEQNYFSELDRKDTEISRLKAQISSLEEASRPLLENKEKKQDHTDLDLPKSVLDMLKLIEKFDGSVREDIAIRESGLPRVEAEFVLGELKRLNLASRVASARNGGHIFKFTHEGRAALLAARASETET